MNLTRHIRRFLHVTAARICLALAVALCSLALPARATYILFSFTNQVGQPDTNRFIVQQVSGPTANADGSFTTIGLPIPIMPWTNGLATNFLMQGNWFATNKFLGKGIYFGNFPQDAGPTVYRMFDYQISGANLFITRITGNTNAVTQSQVTNAIGYQPVSYPDLLGTNTANLVITTNVANQAQTNAMVVATNTAAAERAALIATNTLALAALAAGTNAAVASAQATLILSNTAILITATNLTAAERAALVATNLLLLADITATNGLILATATNLTMTASNSIYRAATNAPSSQSAFNATNGMQNGAFMDTNAFKVTITNIASSVSGAGFIATNNGNGNRTTLTNAISINVTNLYSTNISTVASLDVNSANLIISTGPAVHANPGDANYIAAGDLILKGGVGGPGNAGGGNVRILGGSGTGYPGVPGSSIFLAPLVGPGVFSGSNIFGTASSPTSWNVFYGTNVFHQQINIDPNFGITLGGTYMTNWPSGGGSSSVAAGAGVTVATNGSIYTITANPQTNNVVFQNGVATNIISQGVLSLGGNTNYLAQGSSIVAVINGGSTRGNGSYQQISANGWTNLSALQAGNGINSNGVNFFITDNGTNLYSATSLTGPWTIVSGISTAPVSWIGASNQITGIVFNGYFTSTNAHYDATNSAATAANRATNSLVPLLSVNAVNATNFVGRIVTNQFNTGLIFTNPASATYLSVGTNGENHAERFINGNNSIDLNSTALAHDGILFYRNAGFGDIYAYLSDGGFIISSTNRPGSFVQATPRFFLAQIDNNNLVSSFQVDEDNNIVGFNATNAGFEVHANGDTEIWSALGNKVMASTDGNNYFSGTSNVFTGPLYGDGSGLIAIPAIAISTNGSSANQILLSRGGIAIWTNAVGLQATNGNLTAWSAWNTNQFANTNQLRTTNAALVALINTNGINFTNALAAAMAGTTNLTKYNVNTNLFIAGISQELMTTNYIVLRSADSNQVNLLYAQISSAIWTNNGSGFYINSTGVKFQLYDVAGNLCFFINGGNVQGQWNNNYYGGTPPTGDWGRIINHEAGASGEALIETNIPASAIVGTLPIGDLPAYILTNADSRVRTLPFGFVKTATNSLTATNDSFGQWIGGTNAPVFLVTGSEFHSDFSNATATAVGQVGITSAGTGGLDYFANYQSTQTGDYRHGFGFPTGISEIGDPLIEDSNITLMTIYVNGSPTAWGTNSTGDGTVNSANMNTYNSGSGFNCVIVTNDVNGNPHVFSLNAVQFMWVATNAAPGQNKTNLFGGYHGIIANYSAINRGFVIGGPKHVGAEPGNPNHYYFSVQAVDSAGNPVGKVTVPILTAGVSVPDDPNAVNLAMLDTINGVATLTNATLIGASATFGPFTINSGSSLTATNITATGAFNASSTTAAMNLNSTNVTVGQNGTGNRSPGSFSRLKINSAGDTANGDIYNSNGTGMSMNGSIVYLSAGINAVFAGTASRSSFTNDLTALSGTFSNNVTSTAGQFVGNGAGLTNIIGDTLIVTATNRLVFTTVSSLTNTLGREATAIVTAGTSVAIQDTNGVSIATIGTIATLDVLVPLHVNMRLSGTGVSAILY